MSNKARFYYFKPSGKYYTEGSGFTPVTNEVWGREALLRANGGLMPGLSTTGASFTVVVIPDDEATYGWPQIYPSLDTPQI